MARPPASLALGRFKQLPQRTGEVWQGSIRRLPAWIADPADPDATPYRPLGAFWLSLRTGLIHMELADPPDMPMPEFALAGFLAFGLKWAKALDGRPSRVEVTDPDLRDALQPYLASLNTSVVIVPEQPRLEEAFREMEAQTSGGQRFPGALETPGVSVERLRAFADAAAEFYRARPWQHLANEDLIVVEAPKATKATKGLSHLSVLGKGGQEFGLSFYANRKAFDRLIDGRGGMPAEVNGVTFGPIDELPFADADAWEAHRFPIAGPRAYPLFARMRSDGRMTRPAPAELTFAEALLRALARVTEDELDGGRWSVDIVTFDGPVRLTLTLPQILEAAAGRPAQRRPPSAAASQMAERANAAIARMLTERPGMSLDEINDALAHVVDAGTKVDDLSAALSPTSARTALEQAQDLVYDAMEAEGRLQLKLARRALALSEDCADAWVLLGNASTDPAVAQSHYERGVEAGRRAIGDEFESLAGEFWGHLETRPYMRARLALAEVLAETGREDTARAHFEDMLRLNPGDNQGVRYLLLPLLFDLSADEAAGELLKSFDGDARAMWPYAALLLAWRREGESGRLRATLMNAVAANPYVLDYLLAPDSIPEDRPPYVTIGGRDDAASVADSLLPAFTATPGLIPWLERHRPRAPHRGRREGPRRRGR
jgi:tetratricopeptide (TPR) repeat protein